MLDQTALKARRILVIDDNDAIHRDFRKTLDVDCPLSTKLTSAKAAIFGDAAPHTGGDASEAPQFELVSALQGEDGMHKAEAAVKAGCPFNVAFVDMRMPPGWDGLQTIQRLWEVDPDIQVVICTAYSEYSWEEISEKLGLTDKLLILKKPFDPIEVSQLATSLSEKWKLKQSSQLKMEELEEMVQQRTADLAHAALHDKLTGMPNRAFLRDRLDKAIQRRQREPNYDFALLFLDFDRFKLVNDSLGHEAGDQLLVAISQRLGQALRESDPIFRCDQGTAARLGGDEFVILAEDIKHPGDGVVIAERLLKILSAPYEVVGRKITSTASIGVTTASVGYTSGADMIRDADTAMYHAKANGKARYVVFDKTMHDEMLHRLEMENQLRDAAERGQLQLYYQPVISLTTGGICGLEALVRWQHPTRGLIMPGDFMPCAEETNLIVPMGDWILTEACRQLRLWQQMHPRFADLTMSVNVSVKQLVMPDILVRLKQIITRSGCKASSIILEITETTVMRNAEVVIPVLNDLRALGVQLHMDDFGTGYSSLSSLHQLPLTGLKIDRTFVQRMTERRDYAAIVEAVVALARNLNMTLIAEGIEDAAQVAMLQAMGCEAAQGYLFSRPLIASVAEAFLYKPQQYDRLLEKKIPA